MRRQWLFIVWPVILAVVAAAAAYFAATAQTSRKLNTVDTNEALWAIQPGLGTVMIEYGTRFNNVWWAADGGNWDMVNYQLKEMTEIQEVGETTRPARAEALKKFETDYLDKLIEAAKALSSAQLALARLVISIPAAPALSVSKLICCGLGAEKSIAYLPAP